MEGIRDGGGNNDQDGMCGHGGGGGGDDDVAASICSARVVPSTYSVWHGTLGGDALEAIGRVRSLLSIAWRVLGGFCGRYPSINASGKDIQSFIEKGESRAVIGIKSGTDAVHDGKHDRR